MKISSSSYLLMMMMMMILLMGLMCQGVVVTSFSGTGMASSSQSCQASYFEAFCQQNCQTSPSYTSVCSFNSTSPAPASGGTGDQIDAGGTPTELQSRNVRDTSFGSNFPFGNNANPWGNTRYPWGNSVNPWGDSPYPWGNSPNPWGSTRYPWGNSPNPWGDTKYPWGNSVNPWGYTTHPWGNSTYPWGNTQVPDVKNTLTFVVNGNISSNDPGNLPASGTNGLCTCTTFSF